MSNAMDPSPRPRRDFLSWTALAASGLWGMGSVLGESPDNRRPWINRAALIGQNRNRSVVVSQHGMVCASQPLASLAGIDMLQAGGNCVDAAIAANAVLGVTEVASNGIGGDLFALVWIERDKKLFGLNASGRAPAAWNLDQARQLGLTAIPRVSPLSWTVPGCVSGWDALRERFGTLKFSQLLAAAIDYAEHGFPLSPLIAASYQLDATDHASLRALYNPHGYVPQYGDVVRNAQLARSLGQIAAGGAAAFYEGEIAQQIVAKSYELGGFMSRQDLQEHRVQWVDPVSVNYRGFDVWQIPPNGQGIAVLQMLNLLECFDMAALQPNSAEHIHLFVEAKKLVFEDRAHYYADPEFADVPVKQLLSKDYARQRAKLIDPRRANSQPRYGDPSLGSDTIYLTAADNDGNMISLIQSLYQGHGSTLCPDQVGFPIQNRGQSFALHPQHRNRLEPRKRPFHTIIPGFVTQEQQPVLAYGVMGGDFQPQGHCQVLMNMIDFHFNPQQAGELPRAAHVGGSTPWGAGRPAGGGYISLEQGFSAESIAQLQSMGHEVQVDAVAHGGYQAIWREEEPRRYFGGSDPRKDGAAIGY